MEYLVVNTEGRVLAVLDSFEEVARELGRIGRDPQASGRVRVVRHDEHGGPVMGASSFVTASPLPSLSDPGRQNPYAGPRDRFERPPRPLLIDTAYDKTASLRDVSGTGRRS
jgi:hypothetical protein